MTKKVSEYFCVAPWTHTFVSPQGERRLCCASREEPSFQKQYIDAGDDNDNDFVSQTLDEHWNSNYMKDIRRRMLNGERLSTCEVCNGQILNLHTYKDYFNKTLFPNKMDEILENTDEDGYTTLKPISYDYRISNLCNFKCRMCGEQLSSAWETEKNKHYKLDYTTNKWMEPSTRKKISKFQEEVLEEELQRAVDEGRIEEIYWVGGEPLMWERHWTVMNQLVETGNSKDVVIRYNTNLSRITYKNYNLYDMLPYFKRINLCASIDGVGEVGEYIRTGLDWKSWFENFKKGMFLIDKFGDDALVFDVTLTTPGFFDLKNLFDTVTELDVKSYLKITFAFDPSVVMSPMCLPRKILDDKIYELLEYMEPRQTRKNKVYIDTLQDMLKRPTFEEQWPEKVRQGLKRGKHNIEFLESIRQQKTTFRNVLNKDAKKWWDAIE
jgi:sulfatase maturation enzyme AslB (radical SAM superfamily)